MRPPIGIILTHALDLAQVRAVVQTAGAQVLKVVPAWGIDGGWTPEAIAEAAQIAPTLVVRTTWGDPSYNRGGRALPIAERVVEELLPWLNARPDAWIELGNEPLLDNQADEHIAWDYCWHLDRAITACRKAFPRARLIGPAHMRNHPVRLGAYLDGQRRWDAISRQQLRRCDALALHAYSERQASDGLQALHLVSADMPIWLTEFALNEPLEPAARGRRYHEVLSRLPVAMACLYHLVARPGTDPIHFNPNYTLTPATLTALASAGAAPMPAPAPAPAAALPDTLHFPQVRVRDFTMDVRQWRTVEAFRRHLAPHVFRATAPWARGVVVHHTYRPGPSEWRGVASIERLAHFYRFEVDNGKAWDGKPLPKGGWLSGPHLFIAAGSPDPRNDGIWQLTPLNVPGTHARAANGGFWGLEHVGDFTRSPMPPALAALGQGAAAALLDWAGLPTSAETVTPHAQWGKPSCPGRGVDMAAHRAAIAALRGGR